MSSIHVLLYLRGYVCAEWASQVVLVVKKVKVWKLLTRVRLFATPMDCKLPVSSVHGILQDRILVWVAVPFSRGSSQTRGWIQVSHTAGRFFTIWATRATCQRGRHKRLGFDPWVGKIPWRRAWQPTPVFLPGEVHGQRSLVGYSPWGHRESDTTEVN